MTTRELPPAGPAASHLATRKGLNRLLRVAGVQAIVGVGLYLLFALTLSLLGGDPNGGLGTSVLAILGGLSFLSLAFAVFTVINNIRMRRVLRSYPWRARPGKFGEVEIGPINGQPALVFTDTDSPDGTRSALTLVTRWGLLAGHDTIWYAGRDDRSGVASPPGGANPIWVRRMLIGLLRGFLGRSVNDGKHLMP